METSWWDGGTVEMAWTAATRHPLRSGRPSAPRIPSTSAPISLFPPNWSPTIPCSSSREVLFEDYAALFGLTIAAIGNILYLVTDMVIFDSLATLVIGTLLMAIAGFLYYEAKSLLLGEAADPDDLKKIEAAFLDNENVSALRELLTMHLSATQILVNAHVKFKSGLTLEEVEDIIDDIEGRIIKDVPTVYKIFIETHQNDEVQPLQTDPQPGQHHEASYDPDEKPKRKTSISSSKKKK